MMYKKKFDKAREMVRSKSKPKPVTKFFEDVVEKEEKVNVAEETRPDGITDYESPDYSESDDDAL